MASMTDTWSPTSLQLRLVLRGSFSFSKISTTFLLARTRPAKLGRRIRISCAGQSRGNGIDTRRSWASWAVRENGADSMSGWSETANDWNEEPEESPERNKWSGGIVGAGVAGVLVASGLAFAAMSIGKRNTAGIKPEMEPLTAQQEVLLHSENQSAEDADDRTLEKQLKLEDSDLARESEVNGVIGEDGSRDDPDSEDLFAQNDSHLVSGTDTSEDPIEQQSQDESGVDEVGVSMDTTSSSSQLLPESEIVDASAASRDTDEFDTVDASASVSNTSSLDGHDKFASESSYELKEKFISEYSTDGIPQIAVADESDDGSLNTGSEGSSFVAVGLSVSSPLEIIEKEQLIPKNEIQETPLPLEENIEQASAYTFANEQDKSGLDGIHVIISESPSSSNLFSSAGIPAPTELYEVLRVTPGKVLVNPAIDQVQGQALAALQVMKVIEADVQPGDLCTRREYARWLVTASNALSRNTTSKVYPAMYIENVTELAFDDITEQDPDFASIQGLAEAGLISSKLSRRDMLSSSADDDSPYFFYPESPLSRQDLVSWKMALEKKGLPEANREVLHRVSGFIDVDKIHPDACPAIVADLSNAEQGIVALAFGFTKLFQPDKPVTKAQAAVALATGEALDGVSEELTRIEAESMAENAVAAHSALVAQVEKDVHATFESMLSLEREKIDAVEKMAEEAKTELERLRAKREEDKTAMLKERASVDSELEILSRLRKEVEEQLESLMSQKFEISHEKERASQLRIDTERENQEISRLQYELEVERKALSMARSWAEDEAKRAREHTKALEEARDRWERKGLKIVVDSDLQQEASPDDTWLNAGKDFSVESTVTRAETLTEKLQSMAATLQGKSKDIINAIIIRISLLVSNLKQWSLNAANRAEELKNTAMVKATRSAEELQEKAGRVSYGIKDGAKRLADDCRGGVEKLSQKFKAA